MAATEVKEIEIYENKLTSTRSFNWVDVRNTLKFLRKSKIRKSLLVANYGVRLVDEYLGKLDSVEKWDVVEQVIVACLDCNQIENARRLVDKLKNQFGGMSIRVSRLRAMILEVTGDIKSAIDIYANILEKYPSDSMSMKRQISIFTAQGNYQRSIQLLNSYLQIFMVDFEAWMELASLHVKVLSYKSSLFCYEELILNAPINYIFYMKYAEISYSLGGADNYILALKYFTHALELNPPVLDESKSEAHIPTNLSPVYGIIMSIFSYCSLSNSNYSKLKESQVKLMDWAQTQLIQVHKEYNPSYLPIIESFIKSTSIEK